MNETTTPTPAWLADDPKLASIFERIARALPAYRVPEGLTRYSLLESYAALIEGQADLKQP
jgi:hypothetical protein